MDINDAYIIIQRPNKQCKTTQTVRSIWISPLCPRMPTSLVAQGAIIAWTDEGLTVPTASTTHVFVYSGGKYIYYCSTADTVHLTLELVFPG